MREPDLVSVPRQPAPGPPVRESPSPRASRPLRILHLANELDRLGNGIVHVMVDLAIEQQRAGHRVAVGAPHGDYVQLLVAHGVRHLPLPQAGLRNAVTAVARLSRLLRHDPFDIVHAHMVSGALAARFAALTRRTRVITHVHNSWQRHATLMGAGHHVIAVSDAVRGEMISRGIPAARITTVLNGTIGTVRGGAEAGFPPLTLEHPAVLTVAGMYTRKGIADLIEAVSVLRAQVPAVRLYLAGDGPDRVAFEQLARNRGLGETVEFLGFRPDVEQLLAQADVFVLASHAEPCGLVLIEARAAGVAIVATDVGGNPELLDRGTAGVLVPPHSPPELGSALASVILDHDRRARLRAAASANLDAFRVERMAAETLSVYRRVLGVA